MQICGLVVLTDVTVSRDPLLFFTKNGKSIMEQFLKNTKFLHFQIVFEGAPIPRDALYLEDFILAIQKINFSKLLCHRHSLKGIATNRQMTLAIQFLMRILSTLISGYLLHVLNYLSFLYIS